MSRARYTPTRRCPKPSRKPRSPSASGRSTSEPGRDDRSAQRPRSPAALRMTILIGALGIAIILIVLWDAFETIMLPRRIPGGIRISRLVLGGLWRVWAAIGRGIRTRNRREDFLGLYALLSLIGLLAVWAAGLVTGFALIDWACGSRLTPPDGRAGLWTDFYMSGTTFFTLGLGDVVPNSTGSRIIAVVEAGTGFGFLALVLAYLPVLYQAFSRRESRITMLDEWAGSPPSAAVILRRSSECRDPGAALNSLFKDWELTAAEILESHLSYPILAFFRSQHDNQSWLASITAILDTCALVIVGVGEIDPFQARLTFAICRHALVDVSQNVAGKRRLEAPPHDPGSAAELRAWLASAGVTLEHGAEADRKLVEMRALYAPYVQVLSSLLLMPLPTWLPTGKARYNWETTAWAHTGPEDAPH